MIQLFRPQRQVPVSSELAAALGACRRAFLAIGLFSGMSNILMLTGSLFMLEVYDRVLPSRSVPTLVALLILTAGLFAAQGFIDAIRSRILAHRSQSRCDDEHAGLRCHRQIAPYDRRQGRRLATGPRSRRGARLSVRRLSSICRGCRSTWPSASCFIRTSD
jgi:ABC-type protease/lipase transport system fused ATPase/permease subunit